MSTRSWIVLFVLLAAFCAVLMFVPRTGSDSYIAAVYSDGELIRCIDISAVQTPYEFSVPSSDGGENVIRVENGVIRVVYADCRDGLCVDHGVLSRSGAPIICLPHRLVIRWISDDSGIDAVVGG